MKRIPLIVLSSAWLTLVVATPSAAQTAVPPPVSPAGASTGTISGRVRNVVTGQYLNNARVSIKGTNLVVYTDSFGAYRLADVRSGSVTVEVFYTDLDVSLTTLTVPPGGGIEHNVDLTSVARYGRDAAVVNLDPFVVATDRETDAQALATNEQRFAPNIKTVLATDSLGDTLGSNVGEFLKFIPGITMEYDNVDAAAISLRGIGGAMTSITQDGAPASNVWVWPTREVDVRNMALNDIARIEVTKVPTPSTPADSLGGSVNMVGKSAFERSGAELRYGINLVGNGDRENLTFKRTPHSFRDRNTYKLLPGFNFDYTLPIGRKLGIVVSGMTTNVYNEQHFTRKAWANSGTGIAASVSQPFLQTYILQDGPRNLARNTLGLKVDWQMTPSSVLSFGGQLNRSRTEIGQLQWTFNTGNIGTPNPATGKAQSFDETRTLGATGRGQITNLGNNNRCDQETDAANLRYRFDNGKWRLEAALSRSYSQSKRLDQSAGFFFNFSGVMRNPVRISFLDIGSDRPREILAHDNNDQPVDFFNIDNYRGTTTLGQEGLNSSQFDTGNVSLRRRISRFPFPCAVQAGGSWRKQTTDLKPGSPNWTFNGPNGDPLASLSPYAMQVYRNQDSHFGFRNIPWLSPSRAWSAYQANPVLFIQTPAQVVAAENYRVTNSEYFEETVSAAFLQTEAGFFQNRLKVLTGVRYERTFDDGLGSLFDPNAVYQRASNGTFVRDAAGLRVRKPEAGAVGSMEELRLTRSERTAHATRTYDGYYPSLHLTYDLRENFLARAAYAKTYGRPNFTDVIPRTTINERDLTEAQLNDPTVLKGTLTVRNTSLRPWTADNYDVSLEYYTPQGGLVSVNGFVKEIRDFFGDAVRLATPADLEEAGLEPQYVGWNLSTKFNSGNARITGGEVNVRHSLRGLGQWGGYFTLFANATKLRLEGHSKASFASFIPKSGNWGVSFNRQRIAVTARWNHRGLDKRQALPEFGPDGYLYFKARTTLDMNFAYQLTRRLSLAGNINNLLNEPHTMLRYGSATPDYARVFQRNYYGVQFGLGLKGTY
jgi:iron complex outermembrane receptor protein